MTIKKKKRENKCCDHVEKLEALCTVGRNVKWYSCYGKEYRGFFQKIKNRITV